MADFRLRIGYAKQGSALWLSHLEVLRAMERMLRRSRLPYAISQGFSPHIKHTNSAALPVGTASTGEYMDVELMSLVNPDQALKSLQAAQLKDMPILSAVYVAKDAPSLQLYFNRATYLIEIEDPQGTLVSELVGRLQEKGKIEVLKKKKFKVYDLSRYVAEAKIASSNNNILSLSLLSRPEGSLRPEVIVNALSEPDEPPRIIALTRTNLEHEELK